MPLLQCFQDIVELRLSRLGSRLEEGNVKVGVDVQLDGEGLTLLSFVMSLPQPMEMRRINEAADSGIQLFYHFVCCFKQVDPAPPSLDKSHLGLVLKLQSPVKGKLHPFIKFPQSNALCAC